jgi:hypothetical protein
LASSTETNFFSITPILTLFFPVGGVASAALKQPEAQLSCLKLTGLNDAQVATSVKSDAGHAGARNIPKLTMLGLGLAMSVFIFA